MLTPELADALYNCVETNREGFRKIVKKYDKNNPEEPNLQDERLSIFDESMKSTMNLIEYQTFHANVHYYSKKMKMIQCTGLVVLVSTVVVLLVTMEASNMLVAFVLGLAGAFLTAWANAANDICNSVGTAVGCNALTLFQAVTWGAFFEVIGCLTLGPFVSKSIVKGIIQTDDYLDNPELYAFGMLCVLIGAGLTTLLATFYGFPISATHGIIGGLVAVGLAAKGPASLGWNKLLITCCGWVAALITGGLVSVLVFGFIHKFIYKAKNPVARSRRLQPFFLWLCFTVNVLFIFIKGPKMMRIKPIWLAIVIAVLVGAAMTLVMGVFVKLKNKLGFCAAKDLESQASNGQMSCLDNFKKGMGLEEPTSLEPKQGAKFTFREYKTVDGKLLSHQVMKEQGMHTSLPETPKESYDEKKTEALVEENTHKEQAEKYFVPLLIVSAFSVACAHGGNDVGNAVGPLSAILMVVNSGEVSSKPDIPMWALIYGAAGFVIGILTMGRLTIKTVGSKITELTPSKSFATQMGGAVAVLGSSALGLPVSTSHCLVGAVVGIGIFQTITKTGGVNTKVLARIFLAWGLTIPIAMSISLMLFYSFKHLYE